MQGYWDKGSPMRRRPVIAHPLHYIFKEGLIMKDFLMRHPFISFFMVDTVVYGIVSIAMILKTGKPPVCRIQIASKDEDGTETKED